jgi:hypothetical protein
MASELRDASKDWLVGMAMVAGSGALAGGMGLVASAGLALVGLG